MAFFKLLNPLKLLNTCFPLISLKNFIPIIFLCDITSVHQNLLDESKLDRRIVHELEYTCARTNIIESRMNIEPTGNVLGSRTPGLRGVCGDRCLKRKFVES
jgi:hypothetical protein